MMLVAAMVVVPFAGCNRDGSQQARRWLEAGQLATSQDSIFNALVNLQRARDAAQRVGDKETYFEAVVYLAMLYDQSGQRETGYQMLKNLDYVEATTNPETYSSQYYYRLLGFYSTKLTHRYDSAVYYARKAIDLDKRLYPTDTAYLYIDMSNLAEAHLLNGDTAAAHQLVHQLEQAPQVANQLYLCEVYYLHSLLEQNNLDSAYHYAQLAYQVATGSKAYYNTVSCLQQLCRIDSIRGDFAAYATHHQAADQCIQTLRGTEVAYQVAAVHEQAKLDQLHQRNKKDHIITAMIVAMLVLTVTAMLVLMWLFRRNAKARQALADAALQRKKLENQLLQLRMNENEEQLQREQKKNLSMSELLAEKSYTLSPAERLLALETTLRTQHADFLDRVEKQYPTLTESEIRLMGFIKMGVKPKVMAMALNISMSSLNTARYRLRKKLELPTNLNLNEFIQKL